MQPFMFSHLHMKKSIDIETQLVPAMYMPVAVSSSFLKSIEQCNKQQHK